MLRIVFVLLPLAAFALAACNTTENAEATRPEAAAAPASPAAAPASAPRHGPEHAPAPAGAHSAAAPAAPPPAPAPEAEVKKPPTRAEINAQCWMRMEEPKYRGLNLDQRAAAVEKCAAEKTKTSPRG